MIHNVICIQGGPMSRIVHARLDEDGQKMMNRLRRLMGWRDSKIIRQGLKALTELTFASAPKRIIGLGKFKSGISDLGSNKAHLRGFGR